MKRVIDFLAGIAGRAVLLLSLLFVGTAAFSQCNCPAVTNCGPCQGGMTRLTFKFHDSRLINVLPVSVTVTDGSGIIFSDASVTDGETFEVTASVPGNVFTGNQISISILLGATQNINTSCASSILVGDMFGDFELIAGMSMGNVPVCCRGDGVPPIISGCPSSAITASANSTTGTCGTNVSWTAPTVSDNCSATLSSTHSPGDFFNVGTTPVTYTAIDAGGNQTLCTFNVVVTDVSNPVISGCPSTITVNAVTTAGTCGANVTWTPPTVTDNCVVNMTSNKTPGQFFPVGTTVVTYTATDASGRSSTCSFDVVVNDVTKPVLASCPANIVVTTTTCDKVVTWTPPTVTDNCSATLASNYAPGATFTVGVTPVTYTATDPSGNVQTCTFSITVVDNVRPILTNCLNGAQIEVTADNACNAVATWPPPTATDNCGVVLTSTHLPGDVFPLGKTDVTYTATDASGNTTTCTFKILVKDRTLPVLSGCPAAITMNATSGCGAIANWTAPTATDNCSVTLTSNYSPGQTFPVGTTVVTYTARDGAGNISECAFNVTVNDTSVPTVIACPGTINGQLTNSGCTTPMTWTPPVFADNCSLTITSTKSPGDLFPLGTTPVTYTATDPGGNTKTCTFNVVVTDVISPVVTACPSDITVVAGASCNAIATWLEPTFTDNCSVSVTRSHAPGQTFALGETVVSYVATDGSGNTTTCSFKVNVVDTSAPVLQNCPADIVVSLVAGSCSKSVSWAAPTASDNCSVTLTSNFAPGHTFPKGSTDVIYAAKDGAGNTSTCSFTVIVKDEIPPVILNCPSNVQVNATSSCGAAVSWTAPTATDNCSVALTSNHSPGATFPIGSTVVVYTAADGAGNVVQCSFNVIVKDTSSPTVTGCPGNITTSLTGSGCSTPVSWIPPTFADNCSFTVASTKSPGDSFPLGTTTVSYTATDASGNIKTCSFNVVVNDVTAPVIVSCPADIIAVANTSCTASVTWTEPVFTDNCAIVITKSHSPGSAFALGQTVVTYTATDASGNRSTCSFKVTVTDTSAPVLQNCPTDLSVTMDGGTCSKAVTWTPPTATDNCTVGLTSNFPPGYAFPEGTSKVFYTASDGSGNTSTCSFNVTVKDSTSPTMSNCPANIEVNASSTCVANVTWTPPTFSDNCGGVTVVSSHNPNSIFSKGTTIVTYRATDASGNSVTCSFNVTVVDGTKPVFANCPTAITGSTVDGCSAVVSWTPPVATDNCGVIVSSTHQPGGTFAIGTTRVTYTAVDAAGNQSACSFDVIVLDGAKPVFTSCPSDVRLLAAMSSCSANASWSAPIVTDCSAFELTSTHLPGSEFPIGSTQVIYTATDAKGNKSACTFHVIVEDKTAPAFNNCPADITIDARTSCDAIATWTAPAASDNCGISSINSSHQSGDVFPVGITAVTYTATDVRGNVSKCEFNIIVKNKNAPIIAGCPSDVVLKVIDVDVATASWIAPTASVVCGEVVLESSHSPGDVFPVGETTVTYTANDDAGNQSVCSFKVRVEYEHLEFNVSKLITPDGDGINDGWMISNIEKFKDNKVTVFDRWGGVVFSTTSYNNENNLWKGFNNSGTSVPTGTYFYTITVRYRGNYVERKGFIELVR